MIKRFKHTIGNHLINIWGWKTKRKIIVIESDDWGLKRIPSKKIYELLINNNIDVNIFDKYDSLATPDDLNALYDVLLKYKDKNGQNLVITADVVMTNPNYDKIKASNFGEYHYELFTDTLNKTKGCEESFKMWGEGMNYNLFFPQYHGREHVNVHMWLDALKNDYHGIRLAFDYGTFPSYVVEDVRKFLIRPFNYKNRQEEDFVLKSITDGVRIFHNIFGFSPQSFMAPAYCWSNEIEKELHLNEINYIQSGRVQYLPLMFKDQVGKSERVRHFCGQKNYLGQYYTIRNANFEPTLSNHNSNCVNNTMKEIKTAFFWNKPAIISIHRVNFVGSKDEKNRSKSLDLLRQLFNMVLKEYPDVEFMNSVALGEYIHSTSNLKSL